MQESKCDMIGIVHLWDLPQDKIYIKLQPNFKHHLINKIKIKARVSKLSNIPYHVIKGFIYRDRSISLKNLKKLTLYLSPTDINKVGKNIAFLTLKSGGKGIINPNLPFNFNSKEGATFISALFHDGGIDKNLNSHYFNLDKKIREKVLKNAFSVFGILKSAISTDKLRLKFPRVITYVLVNCLGFKYGNRVYMKYKIPKFIFNSNDEIKSAFLRQAFDDDGWVSRKEIYLSITRDVSKIPEKLRKEIINKKMLRFAPDILKADKKLLEDLGIHVNEINIEERDVFKNDRIEKRQVWRLCITNKDNIERFISKVNFDLGYRKKKLELAIKDFEDENIRFQPKHAIPKFFDMLLKIETEHGYFTTKLLQNYLNRDQSTIQLYLKQLRDKGLIKVIKRNNNALTYKISTSK